MKKKLFISLALAVAIGIASIGILYPHGLGYYGEEDIKVDVEKINRGIQITLTSDDPEIAEDIQENARWYRDVFRYGSEYRPHSYGGWEYRPHSYGGWGYGYCH